MDERLKEIAEKFDEYMIGLDDTFEFNCNQCGKCCINREDILLNPWDVFRLSKELKLDTEEFVEEYCDTYIGDSSRLPVVRLRPQGEVKRCRFLKGRKCQVHKAKPTVCATFPIGRCIIWDKNELQTEDVDKVEIQYIHNKADCGGEKETHTVRQWLQAFDIPAHDPFFIKWNRQLFITGEIVNKAEKKLNKESLEMMWNAIYFMLYLNYDVSKDFMIQFDENVKHLMELLELLPTEQERRNA